MPNPYILLGIILLWLASTVGVGLWQRHDGANQCQASWQAREVSEQAQAAQQIKTLEDAARAQEQAHAADVAQISTNYEKELSDEHAKHLADITAIRAGALRLRDKSASCLSTSYDSASQTTTSATGSDAATGCQLSPDVAANLFGLADRADQITVQLAACQRVVIDDRK